GETSTVPHYNHETASPTTFLEHNRIVWQPPSSIFTGFFAANGQVGLIKCVEGRNLLEVF
ncbi:MAG: hypothetical protein K9G63_16260, partial [Melioribacteraceae bacterium]|nr:hypothetical protein [Melioribacteraceae bacterium]